MPNLSWILVEDFKQGAGWVRPEQRDARARAYCELLEQGQILFFREPPFRFPAPDREFLLAQEWTDLRLHKNVSYRPSEDVLRGISGNSDTVDRVHSIFRNYSAQVAEFLAQVSVTLRGPMDAGFCELPPDRGREARAAAAQAQRSAACGRVSEPPDAGRPHSARFHQSKSREAARVEHHGGFRSAGSRACRACGTAPDRRG